MKIKAFLTNWWVLAVATTLFATLVVYILCGLLVSAFLPARLWLIALVWLIFAGAALWRWRKIRRGEKALEAALTSTDDHEAEAITSKMRLALDRAKAGGRDTLYQLPWYVIIGPPGAGKTTIIQKSGLRLLNDEAAQGVGGTRNCDWWFADQAVLIDTAGRYTSQDSDLARDAKGWHSFLSTLKKARPLQPLNGIIVAIGLDEIATVSGEQLNRHIVSVRARIAELSDALGMDLPVYVMFTKTDLVAGFTEFFDDLSVEGRRAVVGATLPVSVQQPSLEILAQAYDDMVQALADRIPARLQSESNPVRRGAALSLPARFIDLRSRVVQLLSGVFGTDAGIHTAPARLRGFYLTSGVQQGTPFDRLLGDLASSLGRSVMARPANPRTFFVHRLLSEVVIAEAGLARPNARRAKRERLTKIAAMVLAGLVSAGMLGAWGYSFASNAKGQNDTQTIAADIASAARAIDPHQSVATEASAGEVVELLDRLRDGLPYGVTADNDPPLRRQFGLYRQGLADTSAAAYQDALQRYLLPRVILMAEGALRQAGSDPVAAYDPLKVYLMLGNRAGARRDNGYILRWVEEDLANRQFPGPEYEPMRGRIMSHVRALLADSGRFGRALQGPLLDAALVETAQASVAAMSPEERALALIRQRVGGADWKLVGNALLPGEAKAFGNPEELASAHVPYLFTKTGFQSGFIPQVAVIAEGLEKDRWMLGDTGVSQAPLDTVALGQLYAEEYIQHWMSILALPAPADYARDATSLARLANPGASPLKKIADQVLQQTNGLMPTGKAAQSGGGMKGLAAALAGKAVGASASATAARSIEMNFQGLRAYAGGDAAPLKQLLGALSKYQLALAQAGSSAAGGGSGSIAAAAAELSVASANAATAAPGLSNFVAQVAGGSSHAAETARSAELRASYAQTVLPECRSVFGQGYPFGGGADLQPANVSRAATMVSMFARDELAPYLERTGGAWNWRREPTSRAFSKASARLFQHAEDVQTLMNGGLTFSFAAAPSNKAPVRMRVGGVPIELTPGGPSERFSWSSSGSQVSEIAPTGSTPAVRGEGPWSLFRLLEKARRLPLGQGRYRFVFNPEVALDVTVVGGPDPFRADGPFALRCPVAL